MWKSAHPLLLAQFPIQGQSSIECAPSLEQALCGYWSAIMEFEKHSLKHYAHLR